MKHKRRVKTKKKAKVTLLQKLPLIEATLFQIRRYLIAFFLFALPLVIYLRNTEYGYTKSVFALIFISFLLVLWVLEMAIKRSYSIKLTGLFLPAMLLILAAALSMINSSSLNTSLQSLGLLVYFFLFYLLLANTVESERDIKLFLSSIMLSAVLAAIYGLLQYYGVLAGPPGVSRGSAAAISTMGNPNYLGGFLAHLAIPALILLFKSRSFLLRGLSLICLGPMIAGLIATGSSGAHVAAAAAAIFFLLGIIIFKAGKVLAASKGWAMALVALILAVILIQATPGPLNSLLGFSAQSQTQAEAEGRSIFAKAYDALLKFWERNSGWIRMWDWWVGYEMLKEDPLLGAGLGNYKIKFLPYKAKFLATERGKQYNFYIIRAAQAHNEYVQIAAEMGLLGILAAGFAIFMIFWGGFKLLKQNDSAGTRFIVLALLGGVVAFMFDALVSFPLHLPASALNLALLLGLLNSRYFNKDKESCTRVHVYTFTRSSVILSKWRIWVVAFFVLVLSISVSTLAYRDFLADVHLDAAEREFHYGRYLTAKAKLEQSLALDFQPTRSLFYLGAIYRELGDYNKSIEFFEKSLQSFIIENTYIYLASMYIELKEYEKALKYLDDSLAMDPEPSLKLDARYMRALIEIKKGNVSSGISALRELTLQHKDYERAYITIGQAYSSLGNMEEALSNFKQALQIIENKLALKRKELEEIEKKRKRTTLEEYSQLKGEIKLLEEEKKTIEEAIKKLSD